MVDSKNNYINLLKQYCSKSSKKDLTSREDLLELFNFISINTTEITFFKAVRDFIERTEDGEILIINLKTNLPKGIDALDQNLEKVLAKTMPDFKVFKNYFHNRNIEKMLEIAKTTRESEIGEKFQEYSALRDILIKILNDIESKEKSLFTKFGKLFKREKMSQKDTSKYSREF